MAAHTFEPAPFREMFPAFADPVKYPDAVLSGYFIMATCNVSKYDNCQLHGDCLQLILNLMTAHLAYLFAAIATGSAGLGIKTSASVDKVSVTESPPPFTSAWQFWLSKSPYGQQLLAILQGMAAGGFYVDGLPETEAFRKVGGIW